MENKVFNSNAPGLSVVEFLTGAIAHHVNPTEEEMNQMVDELQRAYNRTFGEKAGDAATQHPNTNRKPKPRS